MDATIKPQHCCVLLGVFGQQCCVHLHGPKSLTGFKLYTTTANIVVIPCKRTQHVGPNNVVCCWPTMLRPFAGPLGWGGGVGGGGGGGGTRNLVYDIHRSYPP